MKEDFLVCADSSSENRSEIWSVSSHEPSSSDIFFLEVPAAVRLRTQQVPAPSYYWMPRRQVPFTAKRMPCQSSVQHRKCTAQKRCLQQHLEQAADINTTFQRRNQCDQTQFLLDMFHVTKGGSIHLVNGEKVCRNAVYGSKYYHFFKCLIAFPATCM